MDAFICIKLYEHGEFSPRLLNLCEFTQNMHIKSRREVLSLQVNTSNVYGKSIHWMVGFEECTKLAHESGKVT